MFDYVPRTTGTGSIKIKLHFPSSSPLRLRLLSWGKSTVIIVEDHIIFGTGQSLPIKTEFPKTKKRVQAARKVERKDGKARHKKVKSSSGHAPGGKFPPKPEKGHSNRCTVDGKPFYYNFKSNKWAIESDRDGHDQYRQPGVYSDSRVYLIRSSCGAQPHHQYLHQPIR
jgi:hypothetical protein